ncbi:MAG: histidine kinase [Burkholderiales bacterium]|nr:histidine kinase [Burkholderiales bacterium]
MSLAPGTGGSAQPSDRPRAGGGHEAGHTAVGAATLTRRIIASLNVGSLGVAIGFGITAAVIFSPIFVSFPVLLGRTLFLAMLLLLTFVGAQHLPESWLPRWLPRWLFTALAVALAAPLATFLIYLVSVGGDLQAFLKSQPRLSGFVIISSTGLVLGLIITLTAQVREREARARSQALLFELERSRLERQALDARLALLTAQIEPHFLFNTLANVQALVEGGSPRAAPVLQSLIAYLRAAMPRLHEGEPTLGRELALVRAYLELMAMRMPDRLRYKLAADPALDAEPFPAMALLTLVENAVRHGADPSEHGADIEVGTRRDAATGALHLWVADTGCGLGEHAAPGTGLANLRERLQGMYGGRAELQLTENAPHGLRAEIVVRP